MRPLIAKEIRLLLPAFGMALLLAILPVWMPWYDSRESPLIVGLFGIGAVMLALSSFGREFSLRTFPMIMAQPIERRRLWWTKIVILAIALCALLCIWAATYLRIVSSIHFSFPHVYLAPNAPVRREIFAVGGMTVIVALAGSLWTTLLLRQMTAAFWLTILIPGAILAIIDLCRGSGAMMFAALGVYAVAGFWLAWWQFSRAQETAWTGGVITLSGWRKAEAAPQRASRARRPWTALLWKELQLQQVSLMGMAGLFALHLAVICLRKFGNIPAENPIRMALDQFGGVWFIVPLVSAGLCVAEERRLGTIQELLCLPVSSRTQFFIKFVVTMLISGVLSAALLWTAEGISASIGAGGIHAAEKGPTFIFAPDKNAAFNIVGLVMLAVPFLALSLIGLYASTLARGIVQALAAAIGTIAAIAMLFNLLSSSWHFGVPLWRGALVHFITWPVLAVICVWLAYRNFKSISENWPFWRRNLLTFAGALVFTSITTTAIYNRVWELFSNPEPTHGPARLAGPYQTALNSTFGNVLTALLPDRRLWTGEISYDPGTTSLGFNHTNEFTAEEIQAAIGDAHWLISHGSHFLPGSNWVDAEADSFQAIAIRSDGTLWLSEKPPTPPPPMRPYQRVSPPQQNASIVRVFNGTQWKSVVRGSSGPMFLKEDGTLWKWRRRDAARSDTWPDPDLGPVQVGNRSDWDRTLPCPGHLGFYAWQKDGKAWLVSPWRMNGSQTRETADNDEVELEPGGLVMDRLPELDNTRWRAIAGQFGPRQIGVREDGTLWYWNLQPNGGMREDGTVWWNVQPKGLPRTWIQALNRLGTDTNWVDAAGESGMLGLLKADGSLWVWNLSEWVVDGRGSFSSVNPLVRLSRHNDWLAVAYCERGIVALAADGSLWHWWNQNLLESPDSVFLPLPRPSRRPSFVENILDDHK